MSVESFADLVPVYALTNYFLLPLLSIQQDYTFHNSTKVYGFKTSAKKLLPFPTDKFVQPKLADKIVVNFF